MPVLPVGSGVFTRTNTRLQPVHINDSDCYKESFERPKKRLLRHDPGYLFWDFREPQKKQNSRVSPVYINAKSINRLYESENRKGAA